MLTDDDDAC